MNRRIACAIILTAIAFATACIFILVWVKDSVQICEPNPVVRAIEVVLAFAAALFGFYALVREIKG